MWFLYYLLDCKKVVYTSFWERIAKDLKNEHSGKQAPYEWKKSEIESFITAKFLVRIDDYLKTNPENNGQSPAFTNIQNGKISCGYLHPKPFCMVLRVSRRRYLLESRADLRTTYTWHHQRFHHSSHASRI